MTEKYEGLGKPNDSVAKSPEEVLQEIERLADACVKSDSADRDMLRLGRAMRRFAGAWRDGNESVEVPIDGRCDGIHKEPPGQVVGRGPLGPSGHVPAAFR